MDGCHPFAQMAVVPGLACDQRTAVVAAKKAGSARLIDPGGFKGWGLLGDRFRLVEVACHARFTAGDVQAGSDHDGRTGCGVIVDHLAKQQPGQRTDHQQLQIAQGASAEASAILSARVQQ